LSRRGTSLRSLGQPRWRGTRDRRSVASAPDRHCRMVAGSVGFGALLASSTQCVFRTGTT
jgi:hypothetical protein